MKDAPPLQVVGTQKAADAELERKWCDGNMDDNMKQRIDQFIREHHMIAPGECVCVGCSGGADSICLLTILDMLRREGKLSCTLMACHLNHMLRGEESDADEAFVRAYCEQLEIPLVVAREDVAGLAAELRGQRYGSEQTGSEAEAPAKHPAGLEAAGREAREHLYERCIRVYGATKIALAHHMDDQAETVLFHMARGAGLQGLAGIRPVSGSKIRPLLTVRRGEIEHWLTEQGISWCNDASNASDDYARNRLRHHVLPVLETEINAGSIRHIAEAAETIRLADQWIRETTESYFTEWVQMNDGEVKIDRQLAASPEFVRRMLIMRALAGLAGTYTDFGLQHVRQVQDLLTGAAGRGQDLPHGITAVRTYEGVALRKKQRGNTCPEAESADLQYKVQISPEDGTLQADVAGIHFTGGFTEEIPDPIPEKTYTKWLNCDKITGSIVIRTRRPGDYILLDEAGGRQSIKAWMINQKIPREKRDQIPLVVHENPAAGQQGSEVLWIVGGRIGASARVDAGTRRVLKLCAATKENVSG